MIHSFTETRDKLTIYITEEECRFLASHQQDEDDYGSEQFEIDFLEPLICNSELKWVSPSETGDLTDAPMLGIRNEEGKVTERWAYMNYQIQSFCGDFIKDGYAVFVSSN